MEINRRDFITKVSAIAALSVLPSSFVAAMGNEKVEKAKPKYPTLKCDVVVVGAGPGGVPAAIAAARQGAKVILLEEDNMPGEPRSICMFPLYAVVPGWECFRR